jgi:hypothetical protein
MPFRAATVPDLPPGRYYARIVRLEEKASERYGGDFLAWDAEVVVGRDILPVSGSSSLAWGARSKAYRWACAVLGQRLDPAAPPPEYGALVGRRVIAVVGLNSNDWPSLTDLEPFRGSTEGLVGMDTYPAVANGAQPAAPVPVAAPAPAPTPDAPPAWPATAAPEAPPAWPTAPAAPASGPGDDLPF